MAQIVDRDAEAVNRVEENVYIHQGFRNQRFEIHSFEDIQGITAVRRFHRHHFFAYSKNVTQLTDFFMRIPRILYLGEFQIPSEMPINTRNYFIQLRELGCHIFLISGGQISCIYCFGSSREPNYIGTLTMATINDIFPRFFHLFDRNSRQRMLNIARKLQIRNYERFVVMDSCAPTNWQFYENRPNKYRNLLRDLTTESFGIYVRTGAKLMLAENCRRCERTPLGKQHHIRTLVMSGGFLFIEGSILFIFATNRVVEYTKQDLESIRELRITAGIITDADKPIFFLDAVESTYDTLCWVLYQRKLPFNDSWSLVIPENGSLEVQPYDIGICGVKTEQYTQPWYETGDNYIERIPNHPIVNENIQQSRAVWNNRDLRGHTIDFGAVRPPPLTFYVQLPRMFAFVVRHALMADYVYRVQRFDRNRNYYIFRISFQHYPPFITGNTPPIRTHVVMRNVFVREYLINDVRTEYVLVVQ